MFTLYGDRSSGNCLKIEYAANHLGLPHEWIDIDIMSGGSRTPDFLAMNPAGQVPTVRFADGRTLAQSNAILRYLAQGSDLIPADPFDAAKMDEWLFWEQYSHEPNVATTRFHVVYQGKSLGERDPQKVEKGEAALDLLEKTLSDGSFLLGDRFSLADIALLAYTRLAPEGGFDLSTRPAVTGWIARCEQVLGLQPLPASDRKG